MSFDASFDTSDDSLSMQILSAYLEAKAKKDGKSSEDWMAKISRTQYLAWVERLVAAKKKDEDKEEDKPKGKEKGHEHLDLDKDDDSLLKDIWKRHHK